MPVIGFIKGGSARCLRTDAAAFRKGLNEIGYAEGQNVTVEYHWLEGHYDRLPALVADLVRAGRRDCHARQPLAALAAKAATATIPIVFGVAEDPVAAWPCCEPRSAGRQRDRDQFFRPGVRRPSGSDSA